jgi:hypothetical protein
MIENEGREIWWEGSCGRISPIQVVSSTAKSVQVYRHGSVRRVLRQSDRQGYFPTYEEAVAFVRGEIVREIDRAENKLLELKEDLAELDGLKDGETLLTKAKKEWAMFEKNRNKPIKF